MIPRRRVRKIVRRIEKRPVPYLVKISVKLVGARLRDVIHLRSPIAALVHRIRKRIHRHFRNRIQPQHQIRRKPAVQIRQRIVRLQPVHNVSVRKRRQPIEFHVPVPVRPADEIVPAARRINQRAGRKLQRVSQVAARVRKILQRRRVKICARVRILGIDQGRRAAHLHGLFRLRHLQQEIDRLLLPQSRQHRIVLLRSNPAASTWTEYLPGFSCGKLKRPAHPSSRCVSARIPIRHRHRSARHRGPARIGHLPDDRAGSFPLRKSGSWQ